VDVSINSGIYGLITKTFTFEPSYINLIWEANTTVPPLFQGKALPGFGSSITVFAFPLVVAGGETRDANSLSYQWRLNGSAVPSSSGTGRSSFTFSNNQVRQTDEVSVDVFYEGRNAGHGSITIATVEPFLHLYEHDPLRGIRYRAALQNTFTLLGTEVTVRAEPYFFSRDSGERGSLSYTWEINGTETTGPNTDKGELTLRRTGEGEGTAMLTVALQNLESARLLQGTREVFTILFGKTSSGTSIFGL